MGCASCTSCDIPSCFVALLMVGGWAVSGLWILIFGCFSVRVSSERRPSQETLVPMWNPPRLQYEMFIILINDKCFVAHHVLLVGC